ncbi:MAG: protein-methionine-sulfoxide reductase catalytic subunit MsrP [Chloroflexales bacterium]
MVKIPSSEITPEHVYLSRRAFMAGAGTLAAGALLTACGVPAATPGATPAGPAPAASKATDELGDPLNTYEQITTYNNFYEFSTDKESPARMAASLKTSPWQVAVGGLVNKPQTFAMEDLLKRFDQEERIYRLRCVEAWSMVIPWQGFPLRRLLKVVEPKPEAKFVRFETVYAPDQLPGQRDSYFSWPYVEGLRIDEAMNDLALLATGLYGRTLTPQNGAPIRLAVPWKYGFKSVKSIVKIDLVDTMPTSLWMASSPGEYGFYANVNPLVPHPRWSQASERRIGELGRHKTVMYNGYLDQVAGLYKDLDLRANY